MYLVKQFKSKRASYSTHKDHWIWVRITRKEAESLIQSLAGQLATNDPNSARGETQWTDSEKPGAAGKGFFSICVQDAMVCHTCGDEYEPYTGTRYPYKESPNIICQRCAKKVCPYCRHIVHMTGCHQRTLKAVRKRRVK